MRRLVSSPVSIAICSLAVIAMSVAGVADVRAQTGDRADRPGVVVWQQPAPPANARARDESAVRAAGFRAVPFGPIGDALEQRRRGAQAAERDLLDAVQKALDAVQEAYLDQRFDDMLIALAPLEGDALDILARPEHRAILWNLEFQLGLAYVARDRPGDDALASQRFSRALTIQPDRRPDTDLYGPDVANAFAAAVAGHSKLIARPLTIDATPRDARVVIDGVPVLSTREPVRLLPGTHFAHTSAPGHVPDGFTFLVGRSGSRSDSVLIRMERVADRDAIARIAPSWALGDLRPHTSSGRSAIRAVTTQAGGEIAIVIDESRASRDGTIAEAVPEGGARARVITAAGSSEWITGTTRGDALTRALARIDSSGELLARRDTALGAQGSPERQRIPLYKRWWFWLAVGIAVTSTSVSIREARQDAQRIRIFAPQ